MILWLPDAKSWLTGKEPDAGQDWRREEKGTTEDEIVGWHHRLDGHEFEKAPGVGGGQGSLVCYCPWGHKELDMTEWLNNKNMKNTRLLDKLEIPVESLWFWLIVMHSRWFLSFDKGTGWCQLSTIEGPGEGVSRNDLCHLCESPENIKYFQKLQKHTFKISGFNILSTWASKAINLSCSHSPHLPCHPHHPASPGKAESPLVYLYSLLSLWVDLPGISDDQIAVPLLQPQILIEVFLHRLTSVCVCVCVCVCVQLCLDSDPMDRSPRSSSDHGIFQARILEQVTISFSRWASWPEDWTLISCIGRQFLYQLSP